MPIERITTHPVMRRRNLRQNAKTHKSVPGTINFPSLKAWHYMLSDDLQRIEGVVEYPDGEIGNTSLLHLLEAFDLVINMIQATRRTHVGDQLLHQVRRYVVDLTAARDIRHDEVAEVVFYELRLVRFEQMIQTNIRWQ